MLYQVFYEFWSFWFVDTASEVGSAALPDQWLTLLAMASTVFIICLCFYPIVAIFRGRRK